MIGLGKLGYPVALAIKDKGHDVKGFDISLTYDDIDTTTPREMVGWADIIFIAVQTPHDPEYEGSTPLPETRKDFDYSYLIDAIKTVARAAEDKKQKTTLAIISTCLPGTFNSKLKPLLNKYIEYVYNPAFIAMGTVREDYYNPEFNLIGGPSKKLVEFYKTINDAPNFSTDITTAEAIKVSYNTFITMKTVLANLWGEIAHKTGAKVDDITAAWSLADRRLLSPRYLKAGMGDGGPCHPRDNIALSYLAQEYSLSYDLFSALITAREDHTRWLARLAMVNRYLLNLPVVILGRSFKPESDLETGSPAVLLYNIIKSEAGHEAKHVEDLDHLVEAVYIIGTKHPGYAEYEFPPGSVVIDPFRYIPQREGVEVIGVGA